MNYTLTNIIAFATGAAIGSLVAWKIAKTRYERFAREEIDSVKERFKNRKNTELKTEDKTSNFSDDYEQYASTIESLEYASGVSHEAKPYVIRPEDLGGDDDEYEVISCTYYANAVLVEDHTLEVVEDLESTVGTDFINHFGDFEEDAVHIRNESLKCDYEILRDLDSYFNAPDTE